MAPEMLFLAEQRSYNHKIDVWALGVLFVHLITGSPIFIEENNTTTLEELKEMVNVGEWSLPIQTRISI